VGYRIENFKNFSEALSSVALTDLPKECGVIPDKLIGRK
jgi:hypothetical protein